MKRALGKVIAVIGAPIFACQAWFSRQTPYYGYRYGTMNIKQTYCAYGFRAAAQLSIDTIAGTLILVHRMWFTKGLRNPRR